MRHNAGVYTSAPLQLDADHRIRLLRIKNSLFSNTIISCTLKDFPIDKSPPYTAISYTWGRDAADRRIFLQGRPFAVRKNLWDFLRQKRSEKTPKTFYWIDAICINQDDLAERTHQVRFMGQIYSKASSVLVWLGTGDPRLRGEMKFLRTNGHDLLRNVLYPTFKQKEVRLAKLEYWFRAWVVQECVLATKLDLQYDDITVDSGLLVALLQFPLEQDSYMSRHVDPARDVLEARARWHENSPRIYVTPWELESSVLHCSDSRDRIYSQLALMHPDVDLDPDYNKSTEDLFLDIVDQYISLDLINAQQTIVKLALMLSLNTNCAIYKDGVGDLKATLLERGHGINWHRDAEDFERHGR